MAGLSTTIDRRRALQIVVAGLCCGGASQARGGQPPVQSVDQITDVSATAATNMFRFAPDLVLADPGAEIAFLAGDGMVPLGEALGRRIETHQAATADGLKDKVKNALKDGDLLLIKGSNASGMGRLAEALRQWSAEAAGGLVGRAEGPARGDDAV